MLALRASAALALTLAPLQLGFEGALPKLSAAVALAGKKDGSDSRGGGRESKGRGGDAGNESGAGSEADTSSKASGGEAGAGSDGGGNGKSDKADKADKGKNGRGNGGDKSTNPSKGTSVEIDGNNITVIYPDGIKEEIDNGIYQMKDAAGRTIIKRRAKQADIDRLKAMAG